MNIILYCYDKRTMKTLASLIFVNAIRTHNAVAFIMRIHKLFNSEQI